MVENKIEKTLIVNDEQENQTITFIVESNTPLEKEVLKEIEELQLPIFWSDSRHVNYSFDTKLSNGKWLENIVYNNEQTVANAVIYN